ncbi:MAG: hypothetical protein AAGA48_28680 [Myxococcota bacterium]
MEEEPDLELMRLEEAEEAAHAEAKERCVKLFAALLNEQHSWMLTHAAFEWMSNFLLPMNDGRAVAVRCRPDLPDLLDLHSHATQGLAEHLRCSQRTSMRRDELWKTELD